MRDHKDSINVLLIALLVLAVWQVVPGSGFDSVGMLLQQYPLRNVYAAELARPALPLWTPHLLAGYPLLADAQLGALYPPNLILHRLLPVSTALCIFVLSHLVWAALGTHALARRLWQQRRAAVCAALAYGFAGLLVAQRYVVSMVAIAAWLPWLLLLTHRLLQGRTPAHPARSAALLALAVGMQLLAGDPQIAAMGLLAVAAYGLYLFLALRRQPLRLVLLVTSLLAGVALAAAQLLPIYELRQLSTRPGAPAPQLSASSGQAIPLDVLTAEPRSLPLLQGQTGVYRIYTQEKAVSSLPVLRESYSANLSLLHGLSTANGLVGLVPARYAQYTAEMTPQMLNLLGVKYYLIPQTSPADEAGRVYDLNDPFTFNAMDKVVPTPIVMAAAFEIEWYLSESAEWPDDTPLAMLTLVAEETVDIMDFVLSTGAHTAEWAYDRSDVKGTVRHKQAAIARTFPAYSGFPPEDHLGYVYHTMIQLPYAVLINGLRIQSLAPPARIHVERVTLIDQQGRRYLFSHLEGKADHTLAYRSENVAVFENHDVLPRVFLAYRARAVPDDAEALSLLRSARFSPRNEVLLAAAQISPVEPPAAGTERVALAIYDSRRVAVNVEAPAPGYLVLSDAWYPGWHVRVDGREAPLLRADVIFRAVHVTEGEHRVEFAYEPASLRTGLQISAAALVWVVGLWLWDAWKASRRWAQKPRYAS